MRADMFQNLILKRYFATNVNREIAKIFGGIDGQAILSKFPLYLHKVLRKREPKELYIADPKAAQTIVDSIRRFHKADIPFFEIKPGACILSECLLSQLQHIQLYLIETNKDFLEIQRELMASTNRIFCYYTEYIFSKKTTRFILSNIESHLWSDKVAGQIFQLMITNEGANQMIKSAIHQNGVYSKGRIEFFAIMKKLEYDQLSANPMSGYNLYTYRSCLFQIIFDLEKLNEILTTQLLPLWYPKISSKYLNHEDSQEVFYLVRITPRADLLTICAKGDLESLYFFVQQCFFKRKAFIIPKFEQWAKGIGKDLITYLPESETDNSCLASINAFTEFGMMSPPQILTLFNIFRNSPQYEISSFHQLYNANK